MYKNLKPVYPNFLILTVSFFLLMTSCKPTSKSEAIWSNSGNVYETSFNNLLFKVDAGVSGTITSFQLNGKELLGQANLHPELYGSTFWPAPQSNWGWPPYPVLDGEPYSAEISGDTLRMISADCPQSGLKFIKKFIPQPERNRIKIDYVINNISDSIIENVEVDNGVIWYYCNTESFSDGQKLFVSGREGWIAHCEKNLLFIKVFPDIKEGECAPEQAEIEVFANAEFKYIELENHGKFESLKPGESFSYPVHWYLSEIPKELEVKSKNPQLLDQVRKIIKETR